MAILRDLIDKHRDQVPGLKVRLSDWPEDQYFIVVDFNEFGSIGWDINGRPCLNSWGSLDRWELYQPPKAKRKVTAFPVYATQEAFDRFLMQAGFSLNKDYCMQVEVDD